MARTGKWSWRVVAAGLALVAGSAGAADAELLNASYDVARDVYRDLNPAFVEAISRGEAPVDEPRLQELIDANRERLHATMDAGADWDSPSCDAQCRGSAGRLPWPRNRNSTRSSSSICPCRFRARIRSP